MSGKQEELEHLRSDYFPHCSHCGVVLYCDGTDKEHESALRHEVNTLREELLTDRALDEKERAEKAEAELEALGYTQHALMEETVLSGFPGGDREQTLANVRAMRARLAALESAARAARDSRSRTWLEHHERNAEERALYALLEGK